MDYRVMVRKEIAKLVELDRAETVERTCRVRDGELRIEPERWDVEDWSDSEKARRVATLEKAYDEGDTLYGAFEGETLVGISVFEAGPLPGPGRRFNFGGLWVSRGHRDRGVGRHLSQLVLARARTADGSTMYVSATPSEKTVRFYMSLGFDLTDSPDPGLFEDEPEDIHMEMGL